MRPQAVIFDIGNVLIEWQPERFYDRAIGPQRRRAMFDAVDLHGMNDRVDKGGAFAGTIYDTARAHPDWHDEIRMWHDNWIELASPVIDHSLRLLRALRGRGIPVFALTNFSTESFEHAARHYPFLREFDRHYISGHLRVIKPEPEIYRLVEADCGLRPEALLFTDDRVDNIALAHSRGWQTHLFRRPQAWADTLVRAGLLDTEDAA